MSAGSAHQRRAMQDLEELSERLRAGAAALPEIGPVDVGTSPKAEVARMDGATLYRFQRDTPATVDVPLLIVYALVNRHYMTDLEPERSMVRRLLESGLDVYLVDWGHPGPGDSGLGLDDYINRYLDGFVARVLERHGIPSLNLLGICQGGTFSLCYAAIRPDKVRNLVTMVTPVDFHTPDNLMSKWVRDIDIDLMVDALGNVPGELLNWLFVSLKPARSCGGKLLELVDAFDDPKKLKTFLRMERWIHDSPAQAGEAFRQFVKAFFQENRLVEGGLEIGGRAVRLERVRMPVLNVYATLDHIVPPAASRALERHVGSRDYSEFAFEGGHIGIYVSGQSQTVVAPHIADWFARRC